MNWMIALLAIGMVGYLLDREIYFYEGVHLGPRVQSWLYDRWARKYDEGKRASQLHDDEMLARPLVEMLRATPVPQPFVLDFAAGTGRLSYALLSQPDFDGHIIALDLSQGMLEQAARKLSRIPSSEERMTGPALNRVPALFETANQRRVELLQHQSLPLPFPDAAFDAVCALEVLELFPDMVKPLREFTRVLRPGGVLLTSRGTEESGRRVKVKSKTEFVSLLEKNGFERIQIVKWWKLFDRVFAVKDGSSHPVGGRNLAEVLLCSKCNQSRWQKAADTLKCTGCGRELSVTNEGIALN
jgi:ubiquinone/menaquinone biosynthesis C-methylase UbiE